ncbi:hypothetical protein Y032_0083g1645 [Ancylostoma ceylanicum]|uniref:Uncharacterized protein n=1 Tax=Ancylostoma ceylanicum TaxID=53326 RepID=A0A016TR30_9BILA|nr:hypothetical protein Y032_0083g1645 [Ancylostoma ceylanicum]
MRTSRIRELFPLAVSIAYALILNGFISESTEQDGSIIRQQEDLVTALDENEAFVLFREKLRLRKLNISRDAELRRLYLVKPSQNTSQLIDHY